MPQIKIKQHDITDCGAACLASVAAHYQLRLPLKLSLLVQGDKELFMGVAQKKPSRQTNCRERTYL